MLKSSQVLLGLVAVSAIFTPTDSRAEAVFPLAGRFLAVQDEGATPAAITDWARARGIRIARIRGSSRLWEISSAEAYSAQQLSQDGPFQSVEPDGWVEAPLAPEAAAPRTQDILSVWSQMAAPISMMSEGNYPAEMKPASNWALERIRAPLAWKRRTSTDQVVVAVLDSGVDITHPDLRDNLWVNPREIAGNGIDDDQNGWIDDIHGYDSHYEKVEVQDQVGHGTYLAGIIGAVGNNGIGLSGVAWKTKLMVIRGDDHRRMSWTGAVKGAYYARDNGAKVVNASWGTYSATTGLREMARDLAESDVMIVNAVGNNGNNCDTEHTPYPAGYATSSMIAVTAIRPGDTLVSYADYGAKYVHLAAPGWGNPTTLLGGKYGAQAGVSVAAPYVTGAVAMLWAEHPEWSHQQIKARLLESVDRVPALEGKVSSGGVLNLARALGVE